MIFDKRNLNSTWMLFQEVSFKKNRNCKVKTETGKLILSFVESELLVEEYAINKPIEDPAKLGVLRRRRWILQRNSEEILPKHSIQDSTEDKRTIPLGNIGGFK